MSSEKPHFKTRARLLCQLGEQLIKSESIALIELVKNAYDADASTCNVQINNPDNIDKGTIIIEDDGSGMTFDIIKDVWLEIGTSNKSDQKRNGSRTPVFCRTTIGEKGIGRFGVHRLGKNIDIVTRAKGHKECVLSIDWEKIDDSRYIEDLPITLFEREPVVLKKHTGTKITITELRKNWQRGQVREIAREINSLNSPFCTNDSFHVNFKVNNNWLDGILSYNDIKEMALYSFSLEMRDNHIVDFSYDFKPYPLMDKVSPRHVSCKDIESLSRLLDSDGNEIRIPEDKIGKIRIEGRIFDFDSKVLNLAVTNGSDSVKKYLRQNGGVKVFRDNMRIWDYGGTDNDWLELDSRRINNPSKFLSNHLLLAAVYLDGENSKGLIEKANREGFVENDAYITFQKACYSAFFLIQNLRNSDKDKIRKAYKEASSPQKSVLEVVEDIRDLITKNIKDDAFAKVLGKKLDLVSENYIQTTENLMKSAGAGLNLISVLHQIEKIVKSLKLNLKENADKDTIESDMDMLVDLINGYSVLTRNSKIQKRDVVSLLMKTKKSISFRLRAHGVACIEGPSLTKQKYFGKCSDNLFMNAVMNIFDNSIWWLGYSQKDKPQIYIDIKEKNNSFLSILIADNGPGFSLSKDELTNPFSTAKPAGLGMGIGLHLTKVILESMGGQILFPEFEETDLPLQYEKGAIVELIIKRA